MAFKLEDGGTLKLRKGDSQMRHIDRTWASTVHAFLGRTVDAVIATMEAEQPHLTTQKSFYMEISRARNKAELVTDDARKPKENLEQATGERISALEGIRVANPAPAIAAARAAQVSHGMDEPGTASASAPVPDNVPEAEKTAERSLSGPERQAELDVGI